MSCKHTHLNESVVYFCVSRLVCLHLHVCIIGASCVCVKYYLCGSQCGPSISLDLSKCDSTRPLGSMAGKK